MRQGKVKWYNGKKCYGFVTPDTANESGNKDDVFIHSSELKKADIRFLNENDVISFDDEDKGNKLSAINIKLVKRDEASAKAFQERRSQFHDHDDRGGDRGYGRRDDRGPRRDDRGPRRDRDGEDGDKKGWAFWKK
ncbi:MAG: cold shock domain-containing protein [Proteobacteria bacterium]|nr:cold shock domain-containing protein [Pseudomonadota bacterium]